MTQQWPVEVVLPVQWGDMDAFQHVNNVVYLRWFETARIAYFARVGLPTAAGSTAPGPILARATIDFRAPVLFPDRVTTRTRVLKIGTTSFTMGYQVVSEKLGVCAEGEGVVVMFDYATQAKTPVSAELKARIAALEGRQL
ncbi:MAG: acyl-CoA thioesterase [Archangiaceae bacterium]|nr:acyl-CoA thioesterase [Archangiaceae bacterium]